MSKGHVTAGPQALLSLRLRGADGAELPVEAIIDTGFTGYLTLPSSTINAMGLLPNDTITIILADGSQRRTYVFEARIWWMEEWRAISIYLAEGEPLLGMRLLYNNILCLAVVDGGEVSIDPIE